MNLSGLHGPTVTGTANVLMAAVLARGETIIHGAAREPEIVDLGEFLISLGAHIDGLGTSTLHIRGVQQLGGTGSTIYRIIPDRIETATLLLAGAITGGDVTVRNCRPDHLDATLAVLEDAGVMIDTGRDSVHAAIAHRPLCFHFHALPHPGVPTDLQPQLTALAAIADGVSTIADCVFPYRFAHVPELIRLGANIAHQKGSVEITGVEQFIHGPAVSLGNPSDSTVAVENACEVFATDLRAGASLVLAGLAAPSRCVIRHAHHLRRGYESLPEKLRFLGAHVDGHVTCYNSAELQKVA